MISVLANIEHWQFKATRATETQIAPIPVNFIPIQPISTEVFFPSPAVIVNNFPILYS